MADLRRKTVSPEEQGKIFPLIFGRFMDEVIGCLSKKDLLLLYFKIARALN